MTGMPKRSRRQRHDRRLTMRLVPVKSETQSDIQALHRARSRLVAERTALINHPRALLVERGIVVAQARRKLEDALGAFADEEDERLSARIHLLVEDLRAEWRGLDQRIAAFDAGFVAMAREDEAARCLCSVPGIGVINATALVAAVDDAQSFERGRDLAAWLCLAPRQKTTGGKPRLLGISKRGNRYLRANLIHGVRTVPPNVMVQDTPLGQWVRGLSARAHKNVVVVALAAKLARIAWAVLRKGCRFDPAVAAAWEHGAVG